MESRALKSRADLNTKVHSTFVACSLGGNGRFQDHLNVWKGHNQVTEHPLRKDKWPQWSDRLISSDLEGYNTSYNCTFSLYYS